MISVRGLTKSFGVGESRTTVLNNINLEVEKGQVFGIIGRSGAGKSTLVRCLTLLEQADSGTLIVNRLNLSLMGTQELRLARRHVGMIFQQFNLLNRRTVAENVALPLTFQGIEQTAIDERVSEVLALTGLTDYAHRYPHQLSGGQKQRVAIARALAPNPKVLICDEPTSALDPKATASIFELLKSLNKTLNLTILLITHEMDVVKSVCNQVALLNNGEIIEQNDVIRLFTEPKTTVAKEFVKAASRMDIPKSLRRLMQAKADNSAGTVLRLSYHGKTASQPIIGFLIQKYRLVINIIQANIEIIQNETVGIMIVEMRGEPSSLQKGILFLEHNHLHVELLGYIRHDA